MGRILVTTVALLTTMLATGCGGTSKSLTRTELIAKADPVCRRINAEITYYTNLTPSNSQDLVSASAVARAAPRISLTEHAAQASLEKLTPPSAMAGDWKQIVAGVQTLAEDTQQLGVSIQAKNTSRTIALTSSASGTLQRVHTLAAQDGFHDCAKLQ
jgi:hypothetical protein